MSTNRRKTPGGGGRAERASAMSSWWPLVLGLAVVLVAAMLFIGVRTLSGGDSGGASAPVAAASGQKLPSFITDSPARVQEAYAFVSMRGDETTFMPCYCGCGTHSGHRWIRDCFVKDWTASGVVYDNHGSGCDICVTIALTLKKGIADGQSLASIRKGIDAKYGQPGPPTNTPLPPG
jgi:hypothetical protein